MKVIPFRSMILGLTALLFLGPAAGAQAGQPVPDGGEILVNTTTAQSQDNPDVAVDEAGNFVVVWESGFFLGDQNVFAQLYGANGSPVGGEIQINTFTASQQTGARVGMDANGSFVVTWYSRGQFPPAIFSIMGRRFDSAGNPLGGEFEISTGQTAIFQDVAMDRDGNFLVIWNGRPAGTSGISSIYARLFDSTGAPRTSPFLVYQKQDFDSDFPSVTAAPGGSWIVSWRSDSNLATGNADILAQRFDAGGNPVGSRIVVPVPADAHRQDQKVAASGDRAVVSWVDYSGDGSSRARLFDGGLSPLTGELQPSALPGQPIQDSAVAIDGAGNFVAAWTELDGDLPTRDGSEASIVARAFDASGNPLGDDFVINSTTEGFQAQPSLAMSPSGRLVAVWSGPGSDQNEIFAQAFTVAVPTPQEQVMALIDQINSLLSAGLLGSNEANQLINALESVLKELAGPPLALNASDAGTGPKVAKNTKVCDKINAFLKRVEKIIRKGSLPAAEGQALLDAGTALQANAGC